MKLLRFMVRNHRSIREEQVLDLAPSLKNATVPPAESGTSAPGNSSEERWLDVLSPAVAILGANAAGKTNMLDAMSFAQGAIRFSATRWQDVEEEPEFPHMPFRLRSGAEDERSKYEFDVLLEGTRYLYGFELSRWGVEEEWLSRVPERRWSRGFERTVNADGKSETAWNHSFVSKGSVRELGPVSKSELILSVALRVGHSTLAPIARALVGELVSLPMGESHAERRIRRLINSVKRSDFDLDELSELMRVADVGIVKVELDERKIPGEVLEKIRRVQKFIREMDSEQADQETGERRKRERSSHLTDSEAEDVIASFLFTHSGAGGQERPLALVDESAGTRSWLSIAPEILSTLRSGGVLYADELDSSLHQEHLDMVIQAFTDPLNNPHGAQLIFTTHNTNILENRKELRMGPESIWLVEKDRDGASEYYPLDDFPTPKDANLERRYLHGRYGAIPQPSPSTLRALVMKSSGERARAGG